MKKFIANAVVAVFSVAFFVAPAKAGLATNMSADVVIGQQNMTSDDPNQGGSDPTASTLALPSDIYSDGKKVFLADFFNSRALIFNSIPISNNASADVVVGQPNMTSNDINQGNPDPSSSTLFFPYAIASDGKKLFIADYLNSRVLIYNSIPTSNNASADVVVGQPDMASSDCNTGGSVTARTVCGPTAVYSDGTKLFVADSTNDRVLVFNSIPTSNNAAADLVIGQADFSGSDDNQGNPSPNAQTLYSPWGISGYGGRLFISDVGNNRVLIYDSIPTANNAAANVVVGQQNMTSNDDNQGGAVGANTMDEPYRAISDGVRFFVSDSGNNRILVFNSIPTGNNASANFVIGQGDMNSNAENQGGAVSAQTLNYQMGISFAVGKLFVSDFSNTRSLIYQVGSPRAITNNKSKKLSARETMKIKKKSVAFSGKNVQVKKGRVYLYQDGVLKKSVKTKKNGKWKMNFSDKATNVNRTYRFQYYTSGNQLSSISDPYHILLRGSLAAQNFGTITPTHQLQAVSGNSAGGNHFADGMFSLPFDAREIEGYLRGILDRR